MQKPFKHQAAYLETSGSLQSFALFWEMGTAKTRAIIDNARDLRAAGAIDALVVVAPNGVHRNWVEDELPKWAPAVVDAGWCMAWEAPRAQTKGHQAQAERLLKQPYFVLAMSYDAVLTDRLAAYLKRLLRERRALMVLDESTRIKTPSAQRTRRLLTLGQGAKYRRILTGTPVTNSPLDVYSQIQFLDPRFWEDRGFSTFTEFQAFFAVVRHMEKVVNDKTQKWDVIVAYQNLQQLNSMLAPISSRIQSAEVLDLPPQTYVKRYFEMSPAQIQAYREMKAHSMALLASGDLVTAQIVLTRLLRLQQITCNYLPADGQDPDDLQLTQLSATNPRLECLIECLEECSHQAIIWARFTEDINQICGRLGDACVRYDGRTTSDQRVLAKNRFQAGDVQWFVANPAAGATGLTLTAARTVVYYNNSFKLEDRLQSEKRAHRAGQQHPVNYIDILAPRTIDVKVLDALRAKKQIAAVVTGDNFEEWV